MTADLKPSDFFSDFDSGSLLDLTRTGPAEFEFGVQPKSVYGEQGSLQVWFYGACRLEGVEILECEVLRFVVRPPHRLDNIRPVYSYDNDSWEYVPEPYGPSGDGFSFEIPLHPQIERVCFAAHFPYPSSRYYDRCSAAGSSRFAHISTIGTTERGRDILSLAITDPSVPDSGKRRVVLSAGSHAGETASLWGMEGIVDFLLSGVAEAAEMLRSTVFHIVPMLNIDGAAMGLDRRSAAGINLYFDYREFKSSESRAVWKLVGEVRPDIWLDLHSWHLGIAEGAYGPDPAVIGERTFNARVKPLLDAVARRFPINNYGLDTLDCPNTQALLRYDIPGFCPEFNMGLGADGKWKSIADQKALGVDLLRGLCPAQTP